jgi:hypothetical protein
MARRLAALRVAAVQARPRAAEAVVVAVAVRPRHQRVPWRGLRTGIPTSVDFGTFRTRRLRESKGLTRRPVAVVVAAAAVVAVAALAAAELLAEAAPMAALR